MQKKLSRLDRVTKVRSLCDYNGLFVRLLCQEKSDEKPNHLFYHLDRLGPVRFHTLAGAQDLGYH